MLNIWQIYFDKISKGNCYPEWNLYNNAGELTEHFENSVIKKLVDQGEHKKADYFGVFSHDIRKDMPFREGGLAFNPNNLEAVVNDSPDIDVFSFQKRRKQKNIATQAENYHKGFIKILNTILFETGFLNELPSRLDYIILWNYFIARADIYERYVTELLTPAMEVLETIPEAYNNANYKTTDLATKERFMDAFDRTHYPYHPFVLERLPSIFMQKYKNEYSFKHIF